MHRHRLALLLLTLVACGDDDVGEPFCPAGSYFDGDVCVLDEDAGSTGDMGPCGDCGDEVCDEVTLSCVACIRDTDCSDGDRCDTDLADPSMNRCVACTSDAHCTDPAAAKCDTAAGTCTACDDSTQCEGTGQNVCSDGACVQCSEDTAETHCGANSCDPATGECTDTPRSSVRRCGACVADSECSQADDRCVAMNFMETPRPGGYCLKRFATTCTPPYASPTEMRASLSGAEAEQYCGIREDLTTCEAVLDLIDGTTCEEDVECGAEGLDDSQCETVNGIPNLCSYECDGATDCRSGTACGSSMYCGSRI